MRALLCRWAVDDDGFRSVTVRAERWPLPRRAADTRAGRCPGDLPPPTATRIVRGPRILTLPQLSDGSELERGRFLCRFLTLFDVLTWRQMSKCAMGPVLIVIGAPGSEDRLRVRDGFEGVHVETLIA